MSANKRYPWECDGNLYNQDYEQLKSTSLATGELFVDPCFPPTDTSLYYSDTSDFAIKVRDKYLLHGCVLPKYCLQMMIRSLL